MFKKLASAGKNFMITNHYAQAQKLPRVAPTGCHLIWDFLRISPVFFSIKENKLQIFTKYSPIFCADLYVTVNTGVSETSYCFACHFTAKKQIFMISWDMYIRYPRFLRLPF
jgi:hypothetical protein